MDAAGHLTLLSKAFADYKACAQSPGSINSKCQLGSLAEQLQKQGIYGDQALQLLQGFKNQIGWQTMHPDEFRRFYQFVFFLCREQGKRNLQVPLAVAAWHALLEGRFRLLERWCTYMSNQYKQLVVTEDTWVQLLEFSRTVHEDLSNYDPTAAWPVALDEFVEHVRHAAKKTPEPMDLGSSWPHEHLVLPAVSPRSGSKRRSSALGVAEAAAAVAEQLQQLPLLTSNSDPQQQQQHQLALQPGAQPDKQRAAHTFKRYRVSPAPAAPAAAAAAAPPQAPEAAAAAAAAAQAGPVGFRSPAPTGLAAAGQRGCEACEGLNMQAGGFNHHQGHHHRMVGGLHPLAKASSAAAAAGAGGGGGGRGGWGGCGGPMQDQAMAMDSPMVPMHCGAMPPLAPQPAAGGRAVHWDMGGPQPMCLNNMGGGQQHQHQQHMQQVHGRVASVDAVRCSSVNAMMQATVTDTLFYA